MRERDFGGVRSTDPETSRRAAVSPGLAALEQRVADLLARHPDGLTSHEIAELLHVERDSVSPRMKKLVKVGLAVDTDRKRVPPGRSRASTVWGPPTPKPSTSLFGDDAGQEPGAYD